MKYYRLLSMFPALPEAPEAPPISLDAAREAILEELSEHDRVLAAALLGFLDCRNVEALLQGHDVFDQRALLSGEQLRERSDLPPYLADFLESWDSGALSDDYPFEALWRGYYSYLLELADHEHSVFLQEWVTFEITLRDTLAKRRAEAMGRKGEGNTSGIAVQGGENHSALLSAITEASSPMDQERILDQARLGKIESISGIDPFSTDAALAYLAASLILDRWNIGKSADIAKMLEVFT